jgi:leucyl/phenylalanyl-tRNA---protein transferase
MIFQLDGTAPEMRFPNPAHAERDPDGLLAVGGDLTPKRLINAYSQGIFPWYSEHQPVLWWSPDPRTLIFPEQLHVSRSLRRQMRQGGLTLRMDSGYEEVLLGCAAPRRDQNGTWLLPEMREAYLQLYELDIAHSIELWQGKRLVGGMYGLALGAAFFGESMFSRVPSASRIVMVHLCEQLSAHGFHFLDCQVFNPHLGRMGAVQLPRQAYLERLRCALLSEADPRIWSQPSVDCARLAHARA